MPSVAEKRKRKSIQDHAKPEGNGHQRSGERGQRNTARLLGLCVGVTILTVATNVMLVCCAASGISKEGDT